MYLKVLGALCLTKILYIAQLIDINQCKIIFGTVLSCAPQFLSQTKFDSSIFSIFTSCKIWLLTAIFNLSFQNCFDFNYL